MRFIKLFLNVIIINGKFVLNVNTGNNAKNFAINSISIYYYYYYNIFFFVNSYENKIKNI